MHASQAAEPRFENQQFRTRLRATPGVLGLLALCLVPIGGGLGRMMTAGSHTESRVEREIVVGNDVFRVPENAIRFESARRDGVQPRLDLYLAWPDLEGYSRDRREAFNHLGGDNAIIFLTLEPRELSRDMSGRLKLVYRHLLAPDAANGPAGLLLYRFRQDTDHVGEVLVVGERPGTVPFVARCLSGEAATHSLAPCMRDVLLTQQTSVSYRFPEALLGRWREMDEAVMAKMAAFLQIDG